MPGVQPLGSTGYRGYEWESGLDSLRRETGSEEPDNRTRGCLEQMLGLSRGIRRQTGTSMLRFIYRNKVVEPLGRHSEEVCSHLGCPCSQTQPLLTWGGRQAASQGSLQTQSVTQNTRQTPLSHTSLFSTVSTHYRNLLEFRGSVSPRPRRLSS